MVAENWKSGKRSKEYSENFDKVSFEVPETPVFEIYYCTRCFIKIGTSNKKCPCCGESDTLKESK